MDSGKQLHLANKNSSLEGIAARSTILIVDDDADLRSTLEEYFTHQGFSVLEAGDAQTGRNISDTQSIDIALIDLHLPGENGLSLCQYLQEEKYLPVIMLTGDIDPVERVIGLEVGADDFISKPFELREVLARTRSVLRRARINESQPPSANPIEALLLRSLSDGRTERLLLAIMFCDIVNSTGQAAHLGDGVWTEKLSNFETVSREIISASPGLPVKWMGDGLLAVFTTPGRALRAAAIMHEQCKTQGLQLRIGVHCGECERQGEDLAGIAVHISSRVMTEAGPGQTLVTSTVREVMTGGDFEFSEYGIRTLKGINESWQLFSV